MNEINRNSKLIASLLSGNDISRLEPRQFLALLLSYVMPESDVNMLAGRLLVRFGSVSSAMEADIADIADALGTDKFTASIIKFIPDISLYYHMDKLKGGKRFESVDDIAEYCVYRFIKDTRESYSVLLLDTNMSMLGFEELAQGSACQVGVNLEMLGSALFRYRSSGFILLHNHPGAEPYPSENDIYFTEKLYALTAPFGKHFIEHFIIAGDSYMPIIQLMRNQGYDYSRAF